MKFALPDQLPKGVSEIDGLRRQVGVEIDVFKARRLAKDTFSHADADRLEYLMDSRQKINAVDRARIARHESGHAVMSVLIGGQVVTAETYPAGFTDDQGRNGYCDYLPGNVAVRESEHLIAAAGAVAEAVWEHGPRATHQQIEARLVGSHDAERLRLRSVTASSARSESPVSEALPLVLRCWPAIESLATVLDDRGEISHKHVVKALGLSNDHTLHPFELSSIRAGMRGVRVSGAASR